MDMPTLLGRTIGGRFAIEALVGEGAMGAVYRARQTVLGTTVAVKVLHRPLHGDATFAARFLAEARAASRINHPGSVRVVDFGEEPDGLLYIVMEYLDGRTLDDVLASSGPLPVRRIVEVASQILAALAVAHEMGIIHRDLKPENIILLEGTDDEGVSCDVVKVCDFGVAKELGAQANRARVTGEGVVIGTPAYMSPEQARGDELDARSDLYAVGVMIFQLMTGKLPFDATTPMGTALMHVTEEPTRPRLLNPSADERLEAICLKAMRKRADDRYASAREMRAELRSLLTEDTLPHPMMPQRVGGLMEQVEPRARRSGIALAALVLVATASLVGLSYTRHSGPAPVAVVEAPPTPTVVAAVVPQAPGTLAQSSDAPTPPTPPTPPTDAIQANHTVEAKVVGQTPEASVQAKATSVEATPRRSVQRRASRAHARRTPKDASSPAPARVASLGAGKAEPVLPTPPDTSAKTVAAPVTPLRGQDADGAPNAGAVTTKDPAAGEQDAPPLPVFPDPPPPEADPFDVPR